MVLSPVRGMGISTALRTGARRRRFTEKLPTYQFCGWWAGQVLLDPRANAAGNAGRTGADRGGRMNDWQDTFFVGWSGKLPRRYAHFQRAMVLYVVRVFVLLAVALARAIDDPGTGVVDWDAGEKIFRGIVTMQPYPLLHLADGRTLMMSGPTQVGPDIDPALDGRMVEATGVMMKRGTLDMLQTSAPVHGVDGAAAVAAPVALGRWRITGEICDGKCYAGVDAAGGGDFASGVRGPCLPGGRRAAGVHVSTAPVEGASFMMLGDAANEALPEEAL